MMMKWEKWLNGLEYQQHKIKMMMILMQKINKFFNNNKNWIIQKWQDKKLTKNYNKKTTTIEKMGHQLII